MLSIAVPGYALEDPNRRDEYGLKPDDGSDQELKLPDPRLDRGWPGPKPGEQRKPPPPLAPDEAVIDPLREELEVEPPKPTPLPGPEPYVVPPIEKPLPKPPLRAPDGQPDAGSPVEEASPELPELLQGEPPLEPELPEPEPTELSDIEREELELQEFEREETEPSPLEEDDAEFEEELGDPGEW